jgi:hypothetical protein
MKLVTMIWDRSEGGLPFPHARITEDIYSISEVMHGKSNRRLQSLCDKILSPITNGETRTLPSYRFGDLVSLTVATQGFSTIDRLCWEVRMLCSSGDRGIEMIFQKGAVWSSHHWLSHIFDFHVARMIDLIPIHSVQFGQTEKMNDYESHYSKAFHSRHLVPNGYLPESREVWPCSPTETLRI